MGAPADTAMQEAAEWWETQGRYSDLDLGPWGRAVFRNGWDKRNELTKELLEALEYLLREHGYSLSYETTKGARAALAKARGPQ